ncbi:MAG: hypothetical protein ABR585_07490 [Gemmatimonadaceae bacterium]
MDVEITAEITAEEVPGWLVARALRVQAYAAADGKTGEDLMRVVLAEALTEHRMAHP